MVMRNGGRALVGAKHPDRPLPVWGLVLEVMTDGRFYARPVLRDALAPVGVPYDSVKDGVQRCLRAGRIERSRYPRYDPARPYRIGQIRYVYRITDEGRQALERCRRKYGVDTETVRSTGENCGPLLD